MAAPSEPVDRGAEKTDSSRRAPGASQWVQETWSARAAGTSDSKAASHSPQRYSYSGTLPSLACGGQSVVGEAPAAGMPPTGAAARTPARIAEARASSARKAIRSTGA
jgi:hypothetical protein